MINRKNLEVTANKLTAEDAEDRRGNLVRLLCDPLRPLRFKTGAIWCLLVVLVNRLLKSVPQFPSLHSVDFAPSRLPLSASHPRPSAFICGRSFLPRLFALALLFTATGCLSSNDQEVVVYTALDSDFSEPIFAQFTEDTGVVVRPKFDSEANKTVGLTEALFAEKARPRCDVFWNNEILNSLRLEKQGLLEVYHSPAAASYPENFRSPDGTWSGFAARARVLLLNTDLAKEIPADERPHSIHDLVDPRWKGQVGVARPLFGTTATHAACLFAHWGDDPAKDFFRRLKDNAQILAGNKQVALSVASGQLLFGLTDTDDAIIELEKGMPVEIIYPDRQPDQLGTLFIPNTLVLIKNGPNPESARRLVDYLLSPAVETRLANGASAQIPLNPAVKDSLTLRVETPATVHAMPIDFNQAAEKWPTAARFLRELYASGE